jgi:hypothetical protein
MFTHFTALLDLPVVPLDDACYRGRIDHPAAEDVATTIADNGVGLQVGHG